MQFARDFQMRLRRATTLKAHPLVSALALGAGAIAARAIVFLTPASGKDVAKARELGIVSVSILAGHSKSAELLACVLALMGALTTSIAIWIVWAVHAGRSGPSVALSARKKSPVTLIEFLIVVLVAFSVFGRFWNGRAATFSAWSALVEEGEMLAWIDTVLRGGVLSRDTFCLYGPLSMWPVAILFSLFQPSLGLWRTWIFALNPPALIAAYFLLRGITRTKLAPAAGAIGFALLCAAPIPAMSWSLARVGLGLAAIATLTRALDQNKVRWLIATGALIGGALMYSPEVGIAGALAIGLVLILRPKQRAAALFWTTFGIALILIPIAIYLAAANSLGATVENLFLFPRVRMLGFAALPFPRLTLNADSLRAYFVPAALAVAAFATATKILCGLLDTRSLTELALIVFGMILFTAALSRPDDAHFAFVVPPALMLLTGLLEDAFFALRRNQRWAGIAAIALSVAALAPWSSLVQENLHSFVEPPVGRMLETPRGGSALFPDEFARALDELTRAIQSRTEPNESVWVFPNEALLYFLADRPQPTRFPDALFAVTRQQRTQLITQLEHTRPRWAIVYRDAPEVDGIPYAVALPEVVAYLNANYELESNISSFSLLRRKS
jgi:hypothetical protein